MLITLPQVIINIISNTSNIFLLRKQILVHRTNLYIYCYFFDVFSCRFTQLSIANCFHLPSLLLWLRLSFPFSSLFISQSEKHGKIGTQACSVCTFKKLLMKNERDMERKGMHSHTHAAAGLFFMIIRVNEWYLLLTKYYVMLSASNIDSTRV